MHSRFLLIFLVPVLLSVAPDMRGQTTPKDDFTMVREDGVIAVYERWIIFPKSDPPIKAREVKSVFTINSTVYEALRLLQDENRIKLWQKHVSEFKVYPKPDTTTWLEYSYHDIPWPVSDQDHFLEYRLTEKVKGKHLFITFETQANPTLAPLRDGVTRMYLSGSWTLEQISDTQVRATYRILSKPIGIPKIFTDPIIRSNIMSTIKYYIGLLEKK